MLIHRDCLIDSLFIHTYIMINNVIYRVDIKLITINKISSLYNTKLWFKINKYIYTLFIIHILSNEHINLYIYIYKKLQYLKTKFAIYNVFHLKYFT